MARKRSAAATLEPPAPVTEPAYTRDSLLTFADELERRNGAAEAVGAESERHLVTFMLDREQFGIPIGRAREIVRVADITRVPQAPPHIRGVMNLRGRILPVVEIRTRFGLEPAVVAPKSRVVVVEAHGRTVGILVDAVDQVAKVRESAIVPPPDEVVSHRSDYVIGVARMGSRLIILLDLDKALLLEAMTTSSQPLP
jgi:purine-binding chemotaxis protein CheW